MLVSVLLDLLRRPVWLLGIACLTLGAVLQAVALYNGELVLVQPLLLIELPLTLLIAAFVFSSPLPKQIWASVAAISIGLSVVLLSLSPTGGAPFPSRTRWALAGIAGAALVVLLVAASVRLRGNYRAALLATASAVCFGFTAALMKDAVDHMSLGIGHFLTSWQLYVTAVVGVASVFLLQNAFQAGSLLAAQPPLTLFDATVSLLLGIIVFDEHVRTGWWLLGELLGGVLIVGGVIEVARSPLLREVQQGGDVGSPTAADGDDARDSAMPSSARPGTSRTF
jgi:drug/metabolite transporter (DMT)-like permease